MNRCDTEKKKKTICLILNGYGDTAVCICFISKPNSVRFLWGLMKCGFYTHTHTPKKKRYTV